MAISNKLTTVASGVKNIRTALKEIDSNFGAGHISTLDDEIRQIGSNSAFVLYKDGEGNYRTKLCTSVNSIKSSVSGDIIAIILPENVHEIGRSSLSSLTSLEFINLQNITYFDALSFLGNTITIDASKDLRNVEWIAGSAFSNCTGLTGELYLPKLKGFAYKNSSNLGGESAQFNNCSGLTKVMDLGSISSINNTTFGDCVNLTEVHFPETLNTISGNNTFVRDTKLSKIYFKSLESALNVDYVNNTRHPFCDTTVTPREVYINDQLLTNLVIPNTVTSIKACAFYKNTALTSVTIPSSVTSIGNYAFQDCTELTGTVTIPNSVTSFNNFTFQGCNKITNLSINTNITIYTSNLSSTTDASSCGDGTGVFYCAGNLQNKSNFRACFRKYIIGGDYIQTVGGNGAWRVRIIDGVCPAEVVVVKGNYNTNGKNMLASQLIAPAVNAPSSLSFIEIMGTITSKYNILGVGSSTNIANNFIFHLGYDTVANNAFPCSPTIAGVSSTLVAKIYVGDGSSASHDNAILEQYTTDSDWSAYSSKLDTWYNYINSPDANQDYIN